MERILATNYPNLTELALYNIQDETVIHLFTDETLFTHIFKNQILSLIIDFNTNAGQILTEDMIKIIFIHVITTFTNLRYLNFGPSSIWYPQLTFRDIPPSIIISSNLLELHVWLGYFNDCVYLCDGHFNQLHTLHVETYRISYSSLTIHNMKKLLTLKRFSLYCVDSIYEYDELIVPFLRRMPSLEKLDLSLHVRGRKTFVDGDEMKINIINHMPRLNTFTFHIYSFIDFNNQTNLSSNEDIQKTFIDFKDNQIISCVDYFPKKRRGQCYVYSYPYTLTDYDNITNNFPGGIFKCVRQISLFDERPFEHDFFLRISQSFPFLKKLTVINRQRQNDKPFRTSKISIIEYPHLTELDLTEVHIDYLKQFLFHTKTCLPNNLYLLIDYRLVKKVTHNFRRHITRDNCAKVSYVLFTTKLRFPEHLKDYFPHAAIL